MLLDGTYNYLYIVRNYKRNSYMPETNDKRIGELLKARRRELGLTQIQIAERAGIKYQHYQGFENGQRSMMTATFVVVCKVLEALELDIAEFYRCHFSKT